MSSPKPGELWPQWLAKDCPETQVWAMGYEANKLAWLNTSMHLQDRAENLLAMLLARAKDFSEGRITFVCHSLGGLVVKQLIRAAERDAMTQPRAEQFLRQLERIIFLGTPHLGSAIANLLMLLPVRGTRIVGDLQRNNPNLRELNRWFRSFAQQTGIACVVMQETRPLKIFGVRLPQITQIVSLDSADGGVAERVIPIDNDHLELCAPDGRDSVVYTLILDEICQCASEPSDRALQASRVAETLKIVGGLKSDTAEIKESVQNTEQLLVGINRAFDPAVANAEVIRRTSSFRKIRMLQDVDVSEKAEQLARELSTGELAGTSSSEKLLGLGWCARALSAKNPSRARELLDVAEALGDGEILKIADACILMHTGATEDALSKFDAIGTEGARSAALLSIFAKEGFERALDWLTRAGLASVDLDSDGKYAYLAALTFARKWSEALAFDDTISGKDREQTPALLWMSANMHMALGFAEEFRLEILNWGPLASGSAAYAADEDSVNHRKEAIERFRKFSDAARTLDCANVAESAQERAIWLSHLDKELRSKAVEELKALLRTSSPSMRLVALALQLDLDIDRGDAEKAIERATALSGGKSFDAALARFRMALYRRASVTEAIAHLEKHREQLSKNLPRHIDLVIIEMLAGEGYSQLARSRWESVDRTKMTAQEVQILEGIVAGAEAEDPLASLISSYTEHGRLADLGKITEGLARKEDWTSLQPYAKNLYERTGTLDAAEQYANTLYKSRDFPSLRQLLTDLGPTIATSSLLATIEAWSLYHQGKLIESKKKLDKLLDLADDNIWNLSARVEIGLGDWDALQQLVDAAWVGRTEKSTAKLLRAAVLARSIGSGRAKDLVYEAASRGSSDPQVLLDCYSLAVKAGWENEHVVAQWFQTAIELSGESGPIKRMTIKEVLEKAPGWMERRANAVGPLERAATPLSVAAVSVNQPLINLYYSTAVSNLSEHDVRKRRPIYAFGGSRGARPCSPRRLGVEATTLLLWELLEISEQAFQHFEEIVLPHSTLPWLFEEQEKIRFHQPSRVASAKELRQMIAEGKVAEFKPSAPSSPALAGQVGLGMAQLLAAASVQRAAGEAGFVVHSYPLRRVGSMMEETVDPVEFHGVLCSCGSLVRALYERALLTKAEFDRHMQFLAPREESWPGELTVKQGATIYLDGASLVYFQQMRLLYSLKAAGFDVLVGNDALEEADGLISYSAQESAASQMIGTLRARLRSGIQAGKISIHPSDDVGKEELQAKLATEPTIAIVALSGYVDALVSDDRFINMASEVNLGSGNTEILTSLDVLDLLHAAGGMDKLQRDHARTRARQIGLLFCPIDGPELFDFIATCEVREGEVVESAELKAIRENVLLSRLSNALLIPQEMPWLQRLQEAGTFAIKKLWVTYGDSDATRGRSTWIAALIDIRGWAHRFPSARAAIDLYLAQVLATSLGGISLREENRVGYNAWFDAVVIAEISSYDRVSLNWIAERAASGIEMSLAKQFPRVDR